MRKSFAKYKFIALKYIVLENHVTWRNTKLYKNDDSTLVSTNYKADENIKYKEGNDRPSSVNQIPLVHTHDKAGNECYTQENTDPVKLKCVNRGPGRVNFTYCGHAPAVESRV